MVLRENHILYISFSNQLEQTKVYKTKLDRETHAKKKKKIKGGGGHHLHIKPKAWEKRSKELEAGKVQSKLTPLVLIHQATFWREFGLSAERETVLTCQREYSGLLDTFWLSL